MPQIKSQQHIANNEEPQSLLMNSPKEQNVDDSNFLSINDFINAEDYNEINLQESR